MKSINGQLVRLRWMILVLRYLKRLLPNDDFLRKENDKLQKSIAVEIQEVYGEMIELKQAKG